MARIIVEKLVKIFGGNPKKALKLLKDGYSKGKILKKTDQTVGIAGVSFDVDEGELFVLMGLSGSGKSTLIRCINRLVEPTSGSICIEGRRIEKMDEKELRRFRGKKIGMVFQHFALLPNRTVLENIALGLEIRGIPKEDRHKRSEESLKMVGLIDWKERYPNELSGGMKQRIGLARALAIDPDILLMDEPFSALDPLIRNEMQEELLNLQEEMKKTIIFVTHDLDEALRLGDRIAIMRDGMIEQIGTAEEILLDPANEYVAKFLQNVDATKVLTAGNITIKPRETLRETEGPRTAMRKMNASDSDYIFVIGRDRRLKGIVLMEDALELAEKREMNVRGILKEADTIDSNVLIEDIYRIIGKSERCLAVINEDYKFLGVITRRSLISSLAEKRGVL
jgi:glycine betaine/proline transport system ATP-binding protein